MQLGQWLLWRMEPASSAYHIGTALKLCGALDTAALRESFQALIGAHESLRTVFDVDGQGLPYPVSYTHLTLPTILLV